MDLKKFDKNGNPLNLTERDLRHLRGKYYEYWLKDPALTMPTEEQVLCELQLTALGNFEELNFDLDSNLFHKEIEAYNDKWVPYLRREGVSNDREGLLLVGLEGDTPSDSLSRPEAIKRAGRNLNETDFTYPTQAYKDLTSLHPILDYWTDLGRTMLIRTHEGGWFPPHRDQPHLKRDTFRVIMFIGREVGMSSYEWFLGDERQVICSNSAYYVDTRKVHRTHSWERNSTHLILNIPKTWENVMKLMSVLRHL